MVVLLVEIELDLLRRSLPEGWPHDELGPALLGVIGAFTGVGHSTA